MESRDQGKRIFMGENIIKFNETIRMHFNETMKWCIDTLGITKHVIITYLFMVMSVTVNEHLLFILFDSWRT